jgi:hypothetical protein
MAMAAVALGTTAAGAQTRAGIFVGVGAGWGSARVEADEFEGASDRQGDLTGQLRVGTTLSERLLVGAELNAWHHSEQGDKATLINASLAFYFYPADRGLFIKGGAGLSRADFDIGGETVDGIGWGLMGGLGFDIPIGRSAAITPVATFWFGKPGTLKFEGIDVLHNFRHNVVEIGVGITFY